MASPSANPSPPLTRRSSIGKGGGIRIRISPHAWGGGSPAHGDASLPTWRLSCPRHVRWRALGFALQQGAVRGPAGQSATGPCAFLPPRRARSVGCRLACCLAPKAPAGWPAASCRRAGRDARFFFLPILNKR